MTLVALRGLSEYPDEEIRRALHTSGPRTKRMREQARAGSSSDSTLLAGGLAAGYSSGSGDGGDGGSGGCGGGCGGCGGCG